MPAALTMYERQEIIARRDQGESLADIARSLRRSYDAIRRIYQQYVKTGCLAPAYDRCKHNKVRHDPAIYEAAVAMKVAHSSWGAGLIWTELCEQYGEEGLPSKRTLQRWFRREGIQKPRRDQRPNVKVKRGQVPHEVWALDAKEDIQLADGTYVSWLTITDEGSGAILSATLFPHSALEYHQPSRGEMCDSRNDVSVGKTGAHTDG